MSMVWFRALSRYEFAMRVDDDVCIQRFESNPFAILRDRDLVYGYGLKVRWRWLHFLFAFAHHSPFVWLIPLATD